MRVGRLHSPFHTIRPGGQRLEGDTQDAPIRINATVVIVHSQAVRILDAQNVALLADPDGIGGELAGSALAEVALAGDILKPVPLAVGTSTTVNVYADGVLKASTGALDTVARLPAGFTARIWDIDVN